MIHEFDDVLEITSKGPHGSGNAISFIVGGSDHPSAYFNDGCHFYTALSVVISGTKNPSGYNRIQGPSSGSSMFSVWSDLADPHPCVVWRTNTGSTVLLHGRDNVGYRRIQIDHDGRISWAPAGTGGTAGVTADPADDAATDVSLGRGGAALLTTDGDLEVTDPTKGVILRSPNGTRYRLTVADDGTLGTEAA